MRIISGKYKGRKIAYNQKINIRPTTDRAKEAIFNILQNRYFFNNKSILDLCSGTGNIAFEFASRGVNEITAIDNDKHCINQIKLNAKLLKVNVSTAQIDCMKYVEASTKKFDFIYFDPPYSYPFYYQIKEIIISKKLIKKNGCFIIEHDTQTSFNEINMEKRKYGNVHFSIFSF